MSPDGPPPFGRARYSLRTASERGEAPERRNIDLGSLMNETTRGFVNTVGAAKSMQGKLPLPSRRRVSRLGALAGALKCVFLCCSAHAVNVPKALSRTDAGDKTVRANTEEQEKKKNYSVAALVQSLCLISPVYAFELQVSLERWTASRAL